MREKDMLLRGQLLQGAGQPWMILNTHFLLM
jgi:hypothetical protein